MATHIWRCHHCGLTIPNPDNRPVYHNCRKAPPGTARRIRKYVGALAKWMRAGRPKRDKEEVLRILEEFCKPCDYYNDGICTHPNCGCNVNDRKMAVRNKIRMGTEKCPINKWR